MSEAMTVEELKVVARQLGYNIIPIPETIVLIPCTCGSNRREHWYSNGSELFYKCKRCGKRSEPGGSEREARKKWNAMIEAEMRGEL